MGNKEIELPQDGNQEVGNGDNSEGFGDLKGRNKVDSVVIPESSKQAGRQSGHHEGGDREEGNGEHPQEYIQQSSIGGKLQEQDGENREGNKREMDNKGQNRESREGNQEENSENLPIDDLGGDIGMENDMDSLQEVIGDSEQPVGGTAASADTGALEAGRSSRTPSPLNDFNDNPITTPSTPEPEQNPQHVVGYLPTPQTNPRLYQSSFNTAIQPPALGGRPNMSLCLVEIASLPDPPLYLTTDNITRVSLEQASQEIFTLLKLDASGKDKQKRRAAISKFVGSLFAPATYWALRQAIQIVVTTTGIRNNDDSQQASYGPRATMTDKIPACLAKYLSS